MMTAGTILIIVGAALVLGGIVLAIVRRK